MSSSNHNENSNPKRNISTVATGKDILALTKEFGETIGNGQSTTCHGSGLRKRPVVEDKHNYTPSRELPLTKSEVKGVEKTKSVGPIYGNNTVENFKELFSYRKPILLEELEKAHRSLNETNSPSTQIEDEGQLFEEDKVVGEDLKIVEQEIQVQDESDEIPLEPIVLNLIEVDAIDRVEPKVRPQEHRAIPELRFENRGGEEVKLRPIHESSLELESQEANGVVTSEDNEFSHDVDNDFNEQINEPFYEEVEEAVLEKVIEKKVIEKTPETGYNSTQAILAQQRIKELKEKASGAQVNNNLRVSNNLQAGTNQQMANNQQTGHHQQPQNNVHIPEAPKKTYLLPAWSLLKEPPRVQQEGDSEAALAQALLLEETLANFGVKAQVTNFSEGPTITRFEIQPAPGVKVSRIVNLADDIALCLAAGNVRIEAPIPGKSAVGIEVPNSRNQAVYLKDVISDGSFVHGPSKLLVALGKDISGKPTMADLTKMPHLLIAGSTGSGKSVCMNSIITSILYRANPDEVKFLMVDPKMVELSVYNGIPHLIAPVIIDPKKATAALKWVVNEMENRYNLFAANGVRNLEGYNKGLVSQGEKPLPLVVVLIDELADLMMVASREVEESICRLAQKARAAGIHLVIATQRPSVDVITGIIKANIPSRIAFAVSSQIDSRTILDLSGAEKLLGRGDMLYSPIGTPKPVRVQGVFVSDEEVEKVVGYWKQQGKPEYEEGVLQEVEAAVNNNPTSGEDDDELLPEATKLVVQAGQASVSLLQRRFRIGYTRAARLIDLMEERGIVGGYEGSKPRSVLMSLEDWEIENGTDCQ